MTRVRPERLRAQLSQLRTANDHLSYDDDELLPTLDLENKYSSRIEALEAAQAGLGHSPFPRAPVFPKGLDDLDDPDDNAEELRRALEKLDRAIVGARAPA